jgi:hypothetical protein
MLRKVHAAKTMILCACLLCGLVWLPVSQAGDSESPIFYTGELAGDDNVSGALAMMVNGAKISGFIVIEAAEEAGPKMLEITGGIKGGVLKAKAKDTAVSVVIKGSPDGPEGFSGTWTSVNRSDGSKTRTEGIWSVSQETLVGRNGVIELRNSPCCVQLGGRTVCWPPCI